jgi:ribulose-5-phosphate 4-epimerase/fuculose-1-phosphate aldolase
MASVLKSVDSIKDNVSAEEWAIRVDLAAAYRLVAYYGWDDLIFTHLSARVPGPEHHFLINPYNLMFEEITASSLVKIDTEGRPVMPTPYVTNAAGFTIHSAIHMARDDAHAVMHLHTSSGQAVAAQAAGLMPLTQTAMLIRNEVAYHEYEGVATDLEERERLVEDLGTKDAMILRNHGTLTVGSTVAQCFIKMYYLERACDAQVKALSAGLEGCTTRRKARRKRPASRARWGLEWSPTASPGRRCCASSTAWTRASATRFRTQSSAAAFSRCHSCAGGKTHDHWPSQ